MFGFGKKSEDSKTILALSIESSHVRAGFVYVEKDAKPYLLKQVIVEFAQDSKYSRYKANMESAIDKVLSQGLPGLGVVPEDVVCVLHAPWYVSRTHTHTTEKDHPFVFDSSTTKDILKTETQNFLSFAKKEYFSDTDVSVVEKKIIHLAVNGYSVEVISDSHEVRRADVTSYVSISSSSLLSGIESQIRRHVQKDVKFATSVLAHFLVARDIFESLENFLLVSVSGHQTELSCIEDDALLSIATSPYGTSIISQEAREVGAHATSVRSAIKHSQIEHDLKTSQAILQATRKWQEGFTQSVSSISQTHPVPEAVVLVCEKDYEEWLSRVIADSRNKHLSASGQNFRVIMLDIEAISSFVGSKVPHTDSWVMMHALFSVLVI